MSTQPVSDLPSPCIRCGWQYDEATLNAAALCELRLDPNPTHRCLSVGDRIRFTPDSSRLRTWTVRACDYRFIVATAPQPFAARGSLLYSVVDLTGWQSKRYNGAGHGPVRSSVNTLGGGWDLGPDGEGCDAILAAMVSGEWELSHRRVMNVWAIRTVTS